MTNPQSSDALVVILGAAGTVLGGLVLRKLRQLRTETPRAIRKLGKEVKRALSDVRHDVEELRGVADANTASLRDLARRVGRLEGHREWSEEVAQHAARRFPLPRGDSGTRRRPRRR